MTWSNGARETGVFGRPRMVDVYEPPTAEQVSAGLTKLCTRCERPWLLAEFGPKRTYCQICLREVGREQRTPRQIRDGHLRRSFGISADEFDQMWAEQGKRCAICGKAVERQRDQHVDHCHATNRVRAILCSRCNHGLGLFGDDPAALRLAAEYLDRHSYSESQPNG